MTAPFEQAIIGLGADGRVEAWNAGATALYGLTETEALEAPIGELLATTWPEAEGAIAEAVEQAGGWAGPVVRRNRDGDALLLLVIRAPSGDGGVVETSLRLPDEVAAVSLAPDDADRTDRLFVLDPVTDDAGEIVDMTVAYANAEAAMSLGLGPRDLVGRRISELLPGFLDSSMFATHRRVASSGRPADVADWRIELPPGSGYEHAYAGTIVPFGRGVASRSRDVTAERRALQVLDDAQARVRVALAASPVSVGQVDERLVYEWLLDNLTGLEPADLIGRPLGTRTTPEDAVRLQEAARRVMETGTGEELEIRGGEGLERFTALRAVISPRTDVGGRSRGVRIAVIDVSAHRRLEDELRRSRDTMRAVLDHTPGAVYVVDLEGRITFINERAAAFFGTTVEGALGRTQEELAEPEVAAWTDEQDARVLRTGEDHEVRLLVGEDLFLVRRFPVREADGQIRAIGSIAIDLGRRPAPEAPVTAPPAP